MRTLALLSLALPVALASWQEDCPELPTPIEPTPLSIAAEGTILAAHTAGDWIAWSVQVPTESMSRAPINTFEIWRARADGSSPAMLSSTHERLGAVPGIAGIAIDSEGMVTFFDLRAAELRSVNAAGVRTTWGFPPDLPQEVVVAVLGNGVVVQRKVDGHLRIDAHRCEGDALGPPTTLAVIAPEVYDNQHPIPLTVLSDGRWWVMGGEYLDGLALWDSGENGGEAHRIGAGAMRPCWVEDGWAYAVHEDRGHGVNDPESVALVDCAQPAIFSRLVPHRPLLFSPDGVIFGGQLLDPIRSVYRPCDLGDPHDLIVASRESNETGAALLVRGKIRHPGPMNLHLPSLGPAPSICDDARVFAASEDEVARARATPYSARLDWAKVPFDAARLREIGLILLHTGDTNLRSHAALTLAIRAGSWARPWIREALRRDPNEWVNRTLIRALGQCGNADDGRFLMELLSKREASERDWPEYAAVLTLLGGSETGPWLRANPSVLTSITTGAEETLQARAAFDEAWARAAR